MSKSNIRIIPRLDIKSGKLIKGIKLEGLRVVGDPFESAIRYYNDGADELFFHDAVASLYDQNHLETLWISYNQAIAFLFNDYFFMIFV